MDHHLRPRPGTSQTGLADALRARTRELHARAERSGIVSEILRGRTDRIGYAIFLRNLVPAYEQLERALESGRKRRVVAAVAVSELYRLPALHLDLESLSGASWQARLPLVPAAVRYGERVARAAAGDGSRLVAHAYTRYLGDLNGGRVLARVLARSLQLDESALCFHTFGQIEDVGRFAVTYRQAVDRAGQEMEDFELVLQEAEAAFRLNIEVANEVQAAARALA